MQSINHQNAPIHRLHLEPVSRTVIFTICACFLFSMVPHFVRFPVWVSIFVVVALAWRCLQNSAYVESLHKWLLVVLVVIGILSVFAQYGTITGRDAGLSLFILMATFKLLEGNSYRDSFVLIFLCYFLVASNFLFSQSVFIALMMFLTLVVITATLITLNQRDDQVSNIDRLKSAARLVALSIPLMLILFILVPRVSGPLWKISSEQHSGITGLSEFMSPGKISSLIRSNEVAFRVDFKGQVPPPRQLYWRGPVMSVFDGRSWSQSSRNNIDALSLHSGVPAIEYTITLEPHGKRWLLALDIPTRLVENSVMTADYQLTSTTDIHDVRRYSLSSILDFAVGIDERPEYLEFNRLYPSGSNPKTLKLGQKIAAEFDDPTDIVNHVLRMFYEQEYSYTLNPPAFRDHAVDGFLFESKRGFCEHFAGSFALLMRAAGIPARIVTGYQGGEYNTLGHYLIVRQSDAHAWVEVWLENRGWVRIDPTAAVSPARIEQGIDSALIDELSSFRIQNRNPLLGQFLYSWDNLQHHWNDWVVGYDESKQKRFLDKLNIGVDSTADMIIALVVLLSLVSGGLGLSNWLGSAAPRPPDYEIYFSRFLKKMSRRGFGKRDAEDSRHYLQRITKAGFGQVALLTQIVNLYHHLKYGRRRASGKEVERLRRLIQSIRF